MSVPSRWKCPVCGTVNEPFARFCEKCGAERPGLWRCSKGHPNPPFYNYCTVCGEKKPERVTPPVAPPSRDEIEREIRLHVGRPVGVELPGVKISGYPGNPINIHGYECRSILGLGGLAVTLLCVDKRGVNHVLKMPHAVYEALSKGRPTEVPGGTFGKEKEALEVVSRLNHPCIVRFEGVLESPSALVFEFCEGGSLRDVLGRMGRLKPETAAEIFLQIADALAAIHELGYAHGDVKPENILFTKDRIPKLADFNSARAIATSTKSIVPFTPGYAAPEQMKDSQHRPTLKGDVWSLALALYESVTGSPLAPQDGIGYQEWLAGLKEGWEANVSTGNRELDNILRKCLSLDPEKRPGMKELRILLYQYLKREPGV